jgi:hypothetical protein
MISNEEGNKEYRIERLSALRLKDLEVLYAAVYGAAPAPDYFRKKYDTAYTGVEYVGYIALNSQDIPVAYYGVMPCFIQSGKEEILAAQSGDTMTHPGFRYKGLFVELSKICFDLCRESGIRLIFGFPNQNSYHGAVTKLGWKMTESLECFSIPVATLPLTSLTRRWSWLNPFYRKYIERILRRYTLPETGLPNSVIADGYAGLLRDERYFRYKSYSDTKVVRAGKAKAWISTGRTLVIGDLELTGPDFTAAIKAIKKLAGILGIRQIFFHSSPHTHLHELFSTHYAKTPSFPVLFQDFGAGIPLERIKFTFADIDIF